MGGLTEPCESCSTRTRFYDNWPAIRDWYEHLGELAQKIETAEVVDCVSRLHGVPIGHLPS